ncbi:MAG: TonB-dependent receptor [Fimbriimonas sp.]|nr:TonB-dependent receptor [Fimbriimonas sp.]
MITRSLLALALGIVACPLALAGTTGRLRFIVVDPKTGHPVPGVVTVSCNSTYARLRTSPSYSGQTQVLDVESMHQLPLVANIDSAELVRIPAGSILVLHQVQEQDRPVKEITIRVTATRISARQAVHESQSTVRSHEDIQRFVNSTAGDTKSLTKGQKGVAEDSAGQQHIRGEHTEITYVVDNVPLPDTLSGRQGSVVVPSTIDSLEMLTGGFAPEFGGQVAAVLNITTVPGAKKAASLFTMQSGSYDTLNSDLTSVGPLGTRLNYVIDFGATSTKNALEPQQPDIQTAHNAGSSQSYFAKLKYNLSTIDNLTLTVSNNPDALQIGNRTGLPASFASAGQGYGFLGLRNADGTEAGLNSSNSGLLGSAPEKLASQQADGMDINQHEVSEFATLQYARHISSTDSMQFALTALHSGQAVDNNNPTVDATTLMTQHIDNSIEYNPEATRNIHHFQGEGSYSATRGSHRIKAGFLLDAQTGHESYNIQAASQLALDELHAVAPNLCPPGALTGAKDVNGNPVFIASSNVYPTLAVQRNGAYKSAYVQDTWQISKRFSVNYGFRGDWYNQDQNLGQPPVDTFALSPRANFSYKLTARDDLRWSYDHLFNTPPLAQGAIVGEPIQPETLDQYDASIEHRLGHGQTLSLGYYYKDIRNQVDVGLLIPGSEIGLYSGVNFQIGAVHGVEFSYNISPPSGTGWDAFVNVTYSAAMPSGNDNTGAPAPEFNDHDQRETLGTGLAYSWKNGASMAATFDYGSGLASSTVPPSTDRTPRTQMDLHMSTGDHLFGGKGGLGLDVTNLFDTRTVINFQSGFSGTRFQIGRTILLSAFCKF